MGFDGCTKLVEVEIVVARSGRWCWLGFIGVQVVGFSRFAGGMLCLVAKKMFSKRLSVYMNFDVFEHERKRYTVDVQDLGSYVLSKKIMKTKKNL